MWKPSTIVIDHGLAVTAAGAIDLEKIFHQVSEGETSGLLNGEAPTVLVKPVKLLIDSCASYVATRFTTTGLGGLLSVWAQDSTANRLKDVEHDDEKSEIWWNRYGNLIKCIGHDKTVAFNKGLTVEVSDPETLAWHLLSYKDGDIVIQTSPKSRLRVTQILRLTTLVYLACRSGYYYMSKNIIQNQTDLYALYAEGLAYLEASGRAIETPENLFKGVSYKIAESQAHNMLASLANRVNNEH